MAADPGGGFAANTVMLLVGLRTVHDSAIAAGIEPRVKQGTTSLGCPSTLKLTRRYPHVANIKSQMKRILTNKKSQERNKAVKSEVKTAIRATRTAITAGDKAAATAALTVASKKLDKAASKGVIHQNQAANKKSAIAKQVAALSK